ncbi:hypothetical protein LguiA_026699 [Lonicera macranthoides]
MSATTTELPYHLTPKDFPPFHSLNSHKIFLNLLNTKCTTSLYHLKQVHALILKTHHFSDHYISGSLLKSYSNPNFNTFSTSIKILDQIPNPNVFVWNCMLKGCLENNEPVLAIGFYYRMVFCNSRANKYTYPIVLKACGIGGGVGEGRQVHGHVVKNGFNGDGYVKSAGIQMYASFGCLNEARNLLDLNGDSDSVCWNAMIDGYFKCGDVEGAKKLFDEMPERGVSSWNAMVSGLASCGKIEEARGYFDEMEEKDDISWSAMIDGYNKVECFKESLEIFHQMQREKVRPRKFVLSSVVSACANLGALDQGRWIHAYCKKDSILLDSVLGTSFVDMYAKCGRIDLAWEVFEEMGDKKVFSWNAMIGGLAMHGRAEDAIELFFKMKREYLAPDEISFVCILNACAHAGLVDEGLYYLKTMEELHGVKPTVEHYGCVVDLLGRAGLLSEAEELIETMPMKPNVAVLGALLSACRVHGNVELGEKVGKLLFEWDPQNGGRYALLSNIYAKAGRWVDVGKLRKLMKERGVKTSSGKSMIELDGILHEFKVGDCSHPQRKEIYSMLEKVIEDLEMEGYMPDTSQVLFDIEEEEKETALWHHSEKLAISFGLISTKPGKTIRIVKNLRVCEDCHTVFKLISRVYDREIIVRDRARYHHFRKGNCSCNDFW